MYRVKILRRYEGDTGGTLGDMGNVRAQGNAG